MTTQTPTVKRIRGTSLDVYTDSIEKSRAFAKLYTMPSTYSEYVQSGKIRFTAQAAFWNGHKFEVSKVRGYIRKTGMSFVVVSDAPDEQTHEYQMLLYYPVDSRMIVSDVDRAVRPEPNETNTAWVFHHTDEGTHHDYELILRGALSGAFSPLLVQYQSDLIGLAARGASTEGVGKKYMKLAGFYGQALPQVRTIARATFLGEREQSPHPREGWIDRDLTAAIAAVEAAWTGTRDADLTILAASLTYIKQSLNMPAVETRWARVDRLAAEAEAAAESSDTSGD